MSVLPYAVIRRISPAPGGGVHVELLHLEELPRTEGPPPGLGAGEHMSTLFFADPEETRHFALGDKVRVPTLELYAA